MRDVCHVLCTVEQLTYHLRGPPGLASNPRDGDGACIGRQDSLRPHHLSTAACILCNIFSMKVPHHNNQTELSLLRGQSSIMHGTRHASSNGHV